MKRFRTYLIKRLLKSVNNELDDKQWELSRRRQLLPPSKIAALESRIDKLTAQRHRLLEAISAVQ